MTTTKCPICGAEAEELPSTGDFHGIYCPTHDEFEVSDTAMSIRRGNASPSLWERALERAIGGENLLSCVSGWRWDSSLLVAVLVH